MLFSARIFSFLTNTLAPTQDIIGSSFFIALLVSAVSCFIIVLPTFILLKYTNNNSVLSCAFNFNEWFGKAVAFLFLILCFFVIINTISEFTFFITASVFPKAGFFTIIFIFLLASLYSAAMGIEAFSRFSIFVFMFTIIIFLIIGVSLLKEYNMLNFVSPFYDGLKPIASLGWQNISRNFEVLAFLLLIPFIKGNAKKTFVTWVIILFTFLLFLNFIIVAVLGEQQIVELFPLYTISSLTKISVLDRLDDLFTTIWIFTAFIKSSLYLYLGNICMQKIVPKVSKKITFPILGIVSLVICLLVSSSFTYINMINSIIHSGVFIIVLGLIIPIVILICTMIKKKVKKQ